MNLSKPFLISKDSNPKLICDFIKSRINLACNNYHLEYDIMDMFIQPEGPGVIVKYAEFNYPPFYLIIST